MKPLLIPDVHNKTTKAEHIIQKENPNQAVFLGDYFGNHDYGSLILMEKRV